MERKKVICYLCEGHGAIRVVNPVRHHMATEPCPACAEVYCSNETRMDRFEAEAILDQRLLDG